MDEILIQTPRLFMRELQTSDFDALCQILQDKQTMTAYEHAFSDEEVHQWLARQQQRYRTYGFGLWAVCLKPDGKMIGQCGVTMQDANGKQVHEVGYLFNRAYWHNGYATEAAKAAKAYAFETLNVDAVYSIIRDNNYPSIAVAKRNGMQEGGRLVKHYYDMDMPHRIFFITRAQFLAQ